ncbi:ThiF family adenylyltransferase [Alkalithermobacter paradoxus]|uniref:Thiamine biosynthesis protein ThiF n=1 Tax=Alkalithermobacter paradoxus TaxID=29349 RepID=A0A1V4I588_9FIRM|nr:thiamine biosynthesis protein ThiF [[Clostridium] thermoalcaliphilum]
MNQRLKELLEVKTYINDVIEDDKDNRFKVLFKLRNKYEIPLIITFDDYFPVTLPQIRIDTTRFHIPKKPHILKSGSICYLDKEGIVWNSDPSVALDLVFERVEDVLQENDEQIEYHREFNYYFATLKDLEQAISFYEQGDNIEEISLYTGKRDQPMAFFRGDKESKVTLENLTGKKSTGLIHSKALFIPLDKPYNGAVPQGEDFWSVDDIANLLKENLSSEKIEKLEAFSTNKKNYYYLLEIPLMTGNKVTIGLWYRKIKTRSIRSNPIIKPDSCEEFKIYPIYIYRNDNHSLVERGGGIMSNNRVLIIGCGSVGSDVLFSLARSGLKNFTIVDYDKLDMENSYRHFLGMNKAFEYKKKVVLLKEEIESRYPSTRIEAIDKDILELLKDKTIDFNDYTLILIAIGDPNIERYLHKLILETDTPAIFTWVEAYGLGGHALLVNNGDKGCYECLIDEELNNSAALAGKSDKPYTKNINGCSGTFTPYGGLDSMQTALIASRLALKVIKSEIKDNPLVSWKGSSEEFRKNGYETSPRYEKSLDDLQKENTDYIRSNCMCCLEGRIKDDN